MNSFVMRNRVSICKRRGNKLAIIDKMVMDTWLDERRMEVVAQYESEIYVIGGNIYFAYIVVG